MPASFVDNLRTRNIFRHIFCNIYSAGINSLGSIGPPCAGKDRSAVLPHTRMAPAIGARSEQFKVRETLISKELQ